MSQHLLIVNVIRQEDSIFLLFCIRSNKGGIMLKNIIDSYLSTLDGNISIILKDLKSNHMIYSRDTKRVMPSASVIKVLIMIEAFRQIKEGKFSYESKIQIKPEDKVEFSLFTNMYTDEYCLIDIITLMMDISDNTATNVLIDLLGYENINAVASDYGLKNTVLKRKMMDFEAARQGKQNMLTPEDLSILMEKIYRKEILNEKLCDEMIRIMSINTIKEMMKKYIPDEVKLAHKTGELDHLNHDIGILYLGDADLLLGIFITDVADNMTGRQNIENITKIIYENMKSN